MVMRACLMGTMIDVVIMMGRQWYDKSMEELGFLLALRYLLYIHTLKRMYEYIRGYGVRAAGFPPFSCLTHENKLRYETTPPIIPP